MKILANPTVNMKFFGMFLSIFQKDLFLCSWEQMGQGKRRCSILYLVIYDRIVAIYYLMKYQ